MNQPMARRLFAACLVFLAGWITASAQERQKAYLRIQLPSAATRLEIQGQALKVTDKVVRLFESPLLEPGRPFVYDIKATWTEGGREVVRERSVKVMAGQTTELDLRLEVDNSPNVVAPPAKPPITLQPAERPTDKPTDKPADTPKPATPPTDTPMPKPADKPAVPPVVDSSYIAPPAEVINKMLELAGVRESDVVFDLGSGDGRIALAAVQQSKASRAIGYETHAGRLGQARRAAESLGTKIEFRDKDFATLMADDLRDATVVMVGAATLDQLRALGPIVKKLKVGTRVVVHELELPGLRYDDRRELTTPDGLDHAIYLYRVK